MNTVLLLYPCERHYNGRQVKVNGELAIMSRIPGVREGRIQCLHW
jgi:hypothetical protein